MTDAMQILRAATKAGAINETEVSSRVNALLEATGCRHDDEFGRAFDEFASSTQIDHRALALAFDEIAQARDAEILGVVDHHDKHLRGIRTAFQIRTRTHGHPRLPELPEPPEIRRLAARNMTYHNAMVRAGAPRKIVADTLLIGLASIFRDATQRDGTAFDLPHSERSHFVQFARVCLQSYFAHTEVSVTALSERWKRLKLHNSIC